MSVKLAPYSDYLQQICTLIGVPVSRLSTELAESLRISWNSQFTKVWESTTWMDISPYGEARFVGNGITYPNDLAKTASWTATALTITGDNFANPLDGRTTASKLIETAANSAHSAVQASLPIVVGTTYNMSAYARPNGRSWLYLKFNDGVNNYTAFFDVTTGVVGTVSGTGAVATIGMMPSGYYLCTLNFTSSATASATGTASVQLSTDGSTLSYAGDTAKGLYVWGVLLQQTTNIGVNDSMVAFDQTGEDRIECVFDVWQDSPFNVAYPRTLPYILQRNGIQLISNSVVYWPVVNSAGVTITSPTANPVFLWYRKQVPDFYGDTYVSADTYSVSEQVYFTSSDGTSDFYKCVATASAGDTPESDPDKWDKLEIPQSIMYTAMLFVFADWLVSDGQNEKAILAEQRAQARMDDANDKESRQSGRDQLPLKIFTHVSSRGSPY